MAKHVLKEKVLKMRLSGMSYSQIKEAVNVSKSTLSLWLRNFPLSKARIKELRDHNPVRIEKIRITKQRNREEVYERAFVEASHKLSRISRNKEALFLAGLFLYWGEGTKKSEAIIALTNTDPDMVRFFVMWLECLGVSRENMKVKLHLYKDMNHKELRKFWSNYLGIREDNFWKPYIKDSKFSTITYKNTFAKGTCMVSYGNAPLYREIMMSLRYLRELSQ